MQKEARKIIAEVAHAFGDDPPPLRCDLVESNSLEAIQVRDFFAGKSWWQIDLASLQKDYVGDGSACLTFMSGQAFVYYLPSWLTIACGQFLQADAISSGLFSKLIRPIADQRHPQHLELLNLAVPKHRAIARALQFLSKHYLAREIEDQAAQAVEMFWHKYLA